MLREVELPDAELERIARVCAEFEVDGMRADLVTARAAVALAAWRGRPAVTAEDVRDAARLALPHRRRRNPFECARRGAAVFAVERDAESCARIRRNAAAHELTGLYICEGDAADLTAGLPAPDAAFVGGGGLDVLRAVLDRRPPRLVAAYAALERAAEILPLLARHGYAAEGMMHQASRLSRLPDGSHRLAALNPVFLVWGELL